MWGGGAEGAGASRRLRRLITVAALLAVAAVIATLGYGRMPGAPPPALPPDAPPAGVSVFYARDHGNAHALDAYDWSGTRRGTVHFPTWVDIARLRPAPDGSGFMLDPTSEGDYAAYFDRGGRTIFETDDPSFVSQAWADDNSHVCVLATDLLVTRTPGQPDHAVVGRFPAGDYTVAGCSLRTETLLLGSADGVTMVDLRSGAAFGGAGPSPWAVSLDCAYVAVGGSDPDPIGIWKVSDRRYPQVGAPVRQLKMPVQPLAFSGDDSLLVAVDAASLVAIEWRSGRIAWTAPLNGGGVDRVVPRPGGGDFAIYQPGLVSLIHRDGRVVEVG